MATSDAMTEKATTPSPVKTSLTLVAAIFISSIAPINDRPFLSLIGEAEVYDAGGLIKILGSWWWGTRFALLRNGSRPEWQK